MVIETGEITMTGASTGTYSFTQTFSSAPVITAITYDSTAADTANVNVYVSSVSTSSVTLKTSSPMTGKIQFHAILIT